MKHIQDIAEDIREEMEGAMHYAKRAMEYKDSDRERAEKYAAMAKQEMEHAENLHTMATKMIHKHIAAGGEAPIPMKAIWEWEHARMIDQMGRVKALLDMYKG